MVHFEELGAKANDRVLSLRLLLVLFHQVLHLLGQRQVQFDLLNLVVHDVANAPDLLVTSLVEVLLNPNHVPHDLQDIRIPNLPHDL